MTAWQRRLLNLDGGDPEEYRGLDTHLWAVYHGDFGGIVTTLHAVDNELDTGALVARAPVRLPASSTSCAWPTRRSAPS